MIKLVNLIFIVDKEKCYGEIDWSLEIHFRLIFIPFSSHDRWGSWRWGSLQDGWCDEYLWRIGSHTLQVIVTPFLLEPLKTYLCGANPWYLIRPTFSIAQILNLPYFHYSVCFMSMVVFCVSFLSFISCVSTLSLISNVFHYLLIIHVRSTACTVHFVLPLLLFRFIEYGLCPPTGWLIWWIWSEASSFWPCCWNCWDFASKSKWIVSSWLNRRCRQST